MSRHLSSLFAIADFRVDLCPDTMAPMKATKSMKTPMKAKAGAKAITTSGLADKLATAVDLKKSQVMQVLGQLSEIGASEVVQAGKFVVPGLCMIKTREPQLRDNSF